MTTLYVLFDHTCGLCTAAARWLREQPAYVKIIPIPAMSERAALKFPQLGLIPTPRHPASAANFLNTIPGARTPATAPPTIPVLPTPPPTARPPEQVIVVTDEGAVYRGTSAWIMCLWALKKYRAWSVLLATPPWRPRVARIIDGLGRRRLMISRLLMLEAQADARAQSPGDPDCPDGACHVTR
jgi:hypothetical protein